MNEFDLIGRDVDGEPISLDEIVSRQILLAAESLQYVELRNTNDLYDADGDTSTPDHTTTNSDPDVVQVHLAEQEQTSLTDNNFGGAQDTPFGQGPSRDVTMTEMATIGDGLDQVEPKVVYLETQADNSCVASSEDETGEHLIEVRVDGVDRRKAHAATALMDVRFSKTTGGTL